MVWPFSRRQNGSQDRESEAGPEINSKASGKKYLLEDTKPRFANESQSQYANAQEQATLRKAWETVDWQDFSFERLVRIPCFRDAGMTGFTSMFVLGSVMFLYHKNPSKAANWSVGGLMLGSIVGWEQCRLRRKNSFHTAQMAKSTVAAKEKPMLHTPVNDDRVKKEWEGHTSASTAKKPWYKFW